MVMSFLINLLLLQLLLLLVWQLCTVAVGVCEPYCLVLRFNVCHGHLDNKQGSGSSCL